MEGKVIGTVGFRYREEIERLPQEKIAVLDGYSSCNISDGMHKMYTMDSGIKPVCRTKRICGSQ